MSLLQGFIFAALACAISCIVLLGGLGLYTVHQAADAAEQFPALGKFVPTRLGKLHYTERGSGQPLVLLHGASSNLREFEDNLVPALAERFRIINIDRPGYGYSERIPSSASPALQADAIHDLLNALDVDSPVLVGHSLGGAVVMAYALRYPEATKAVVSLAGGTHPWKGGVAWHVSLASHPVFGSLFGSTVMLPAGQLLSDAALQYVFWPETPPSGYANSTGLALALRPDAFRASATDVSELSDFLTQQSLRYPTLQVPVLLIHGTHDRVVPAWNHATRTIKQYPEATLQLLAGAGHGLHHTRTKAIASAIEAWVR